MKTSKVKQPTAKKNNTRRQFWQCARKLQDWAPQFTIAKEHMFTKSEFNPQKVLEALAHGASPKFLKLLDKIEELDAADMKEHGKLFKHFIYSDVDEANYGARMVISALIASGFTNMIPDMRSILPPTGSADKKTFVFLSSKPVEVKGREYTFDGFVQAFDVHGRALKINEEKNVGLTGLNPYRPSMKKYVTESFNAPTNNYGDHIRFIVLDKKFKEGLDLFDVKYAHLIDAMSKSETTQAEGRGTRNCGQKNLAFKSNEGWKLHVFHYFLRMPKEFAAGHGWNEKYEEMVKNFSDADQSVEFLTELFTNLSIKAATDRALAAAVQMQYEKTGGMTLRSGKSYEYHAPIKESSPVVKQELPVLRAPKQSPVALTKYEPPHRILPEEPMKYEPPHRILPEEPMKYEPPHRILPEEPMKYEPPHRSSWNFPLIQEEPYKAPYDMMTKYKAPERYMKDDVGSALSTATNDVVLPAVKGALHGTKYALSTVANDVVLPAANAVARRMGRGEGSVLPDWRQCVLRSVERALN